MREEFIGYFILQGILAIIIGVIAMLFPGVTLLTATTLFIAFLIVEGVFAFIYGLIQIGQTGGWWLFLLYGVASFALGLSLINIPNITTKTIAFLLGVWGLVSGISQITRGISISRNFSRELLLIISGIITIVLSIVMFIFPITALTTLTWVLGIYFIVLGVFTIAQAFRLKDLVK